MAEPMMISHPTRIGRVGGFGTVLALAGSVKRRECVTPSLFSPTCQGQVMRNAKIVCTLGPASETLRAIEDLAAAGMAVARVNASHGDPAAIRELLGRVREVGERTPMPVATILDLQGPEIRTAATDDPVRLAEGETVRFEPGSSTAGETIGVSRSIAAVSPGDRVLLDDGLIECTVTAVSGDVVSATVESGGQLASRRGVNIPGVDLDLEMVTEKDRADLAGVPADLVDFVAASFVRDAEDIFEVNEVLEELDCEAPIIAKIERADAVENMDEIIEESYGIMVARGDLGVECPMEDVPLIQKRLIRRSHAAGVPVITATEMLDSMVDSPRPTRAEASDVANAVLDGTDAVMLSAETAVGADPTHVVETMDRIIREVEASEEYAELREQRVPPATESRIDALARSGRYLARDLEASAVVTATESGYTGLQAVKYRPGVPIVAVTLSPDVSRRLAVSWGVRPYVADVDEPTVQALVDDAISTVMADDIASSGDRLVVLTGMMRDIQGAQLENTVKIHLAAETVATGRTVVAGTVAGPVFETEDGDLRDMPDGAIVVLPSDFDAEFRGDMGRIGGIVTAEEGLTGYPAMVARELGFPMISAAEVTPGSTEDGDPVTLDARRGVVYAGDVTRERAGAPVG